MSWSVSYIGTPEKIAEALAVESARQTGQCKIEFDAAMPHLVELVKNNFATEASGYKPPLVRLKASGSGVAKTDPNDAAAGPQQMQRSCTVSIEAFYETLLL